MTAYDDYELRLRLAMLALSRVAYWVAYAGYPDSTAARVGLATGYFRLVYA